MGPARRGSRPRLRGHPGHTLTRIGRDQPNPFGCQNSSGRLPRYSRNSHEISCYVGNVDFKIAVRAALAAAVLVVVAGCGAHDSHARPGDPNLAAAKELHLDANEARDAIATGVFTLANGRIDGLDVASGHKLWSIQPSGAPIDTEKFQVLDSGRVLLVGNRKTPGRTAYDTATGAQLWSTPAEEWRENDHSSGQFVHSDPRTGAQLWTVDPATLGCATPIAKDLDFLKDPNGVGFTDESGVEMFRCQASGGLFVIGGLDAATGATIWRRDVPDRLGYLHSVSGPGHIAIIASGNTLETVDTATGRSLGSHAGVVQDTFRLPLSDGSAMLLKGEELSAVREIRLEEPDGRARWTVPIKADGEQVDTNPAGIGNTILTTMSQRSDSKTWLVAFDAKTGKRTVVIAEGPTDAGEKPILTMPLDTSLLNVYPASWGVMVADRKGAYAVIPAVR
ncbi:PQQ-binding-like beta-propeller repeat protein [Nocardia seriolae]|nr:PQQ-binding-like beta-propeller repeat protein [Nocardia seriolae]MTJ71095.1 PQQ-binding-like beta-propeller repeat protein [Nocardia seriolae]MTJ89946.1 PQQ-binding-like beta-propeller repeat protein [Nocardia seriolae]MTK33920.1 PQQ-binding-like beta-propeller repeat protein [Nocardia seriolae]MTK39979.1 PQQ-binding-like beta-propeller repeat protein [Nocardia seriolae]